MRKSITILILILFCAISAGPILAQVRPLDPTPPNPAPNIPAPAVPKVTPPAPPAPVAPTTQPEPISPTALAQPESEKQPAKSPSDKAAADQGNSEYVVISVIALVMLVFGILIGRMSVKSKNS